MTEKIKLINVKEDPLVLFSEWFEEAKQKEINDPNAMNLSTISESLMPSSRIVLLESFDKHGFVFYTNLNSDKSKAIIDSPKISMCFHWKSLLRQVRILGLASKVTDDEADEYFNSRKYGSRIGAWASDQSSVLEKREDLFKSIKKYQEKFPEPNKVPRPKFWSGWRLKPLEIEFWFNGENRLHERLKYIKKKDSWEKVLLSP